MTDNQKLRAEEEIKKILEKYKAKSFKIEWVTGNDNFSIKIESSFKKN